MSPHFRVIKLRYSPRHPTQVEAHAVFRRRHIQFFCHDCVYIHYSAGLSIFFSVVNPPSPDQSRRSTLCRPLHAGELLGQLFRIDRVDQREVHAGGFRALQKFQLLRRAHDEPAHLGIGVIEHLA